LPAQIVFGDRSGRMAPGADPAANIRLLFPSLESRVMTNATHTGPMEHPEEFEALIRAFDARL
jgi:pimeloyl-ACP methyl ester carboxylesterase